MRFTSVSRTTVRRTRRIICNTIIIIHYSSYTCAWQCSQLLQVNHTCLLHSDAFGLSIILRPVLAVSGTGSFSRETLRTITVHFRSSIIYSYFQSRSSPVFSRENTIELYTYYRILAQVRKLATLSTSVVFIDTNRHQYMI